jgi:hypothetical protein
LNRLKIIEFGQCETNDGLDVRPVTDAYLRSGEDALRA